MIFFITLFRYFTIVLFFTLHFFSFSQGMQTRERAHCARSVFPFIKKKKKNMLKILWYNHRAILAVVFKKLREIREQKVYPFLNQHNRKKSISPCFGAVVIVS